MQNVRPHGCYGRPGNSALEYPSAGCVVCTAPWKFYNVHWASRNVVADAEGRHPCSHVPTVDGPLLAAAPTLLAAVQAIAASLPADAPERAIAVDAIRGLAMPGALRAQVVRNVEMTPTLDDKERAIALVLLRRFVRYWRLKGDEARAADYASLRRSTHAPSTRKPERFA